MFHFIPWYKLRLTAKHPALRLTIHRTTKGVDLKHSVFTAGEIGDAFQQIINRPACSTTLKIQALEWWRKSLFPMLTNVEAYTDLKLHDFFTFFNDFFFLGALSHNVTVKWADAPSDRPLLRGWTRPEGRGFAIGIYIVKPQTFRPHWKQEAISVLLHEMLHALLLHSCICDLCNCDLRHAGESGITGHGPVWQKLRKCVETAANDSLLGFEKPWRLSFKFDPDVKAEKMAVRRLFDSVKIDNDKENEKGSESDFKRIVEVDIHTLNYYLRVIEFGIW
ncbi:MAG: hypothetical protein Q9164_006894 [Protoblastenia rupestris]